VAGILIREFGDKIPWSLELSGTHPEGSKCMPEAAKTVLQKELFWPGQPLKKLFPKESPEY